MRTVLIVEDEWAIADWLEVLLSESAFNVLVAGNGREALDILHRQEIHLLRQWRSLRATGRDAEADQLLPSLQLTINAIASGLRTTG